MRKLVDDCLGWGRDRRRTRLGRKERGGKVVDLAGWGIGLERAEKRKAIDYTRVGVMGGTDLLGLYRTRRSENARYCLLGGKWRGEGG